VRRTQTGDADRCGMHRKGGFVQPGFASSPALGVVKLNPGTAGRVADPRGVGISRMEGTL